MFEVVLDFLIDDDVFILNLCFDSQSVKNLFEPFNQEDSSKDVADKAMHLSFCHFIITEQHQGQIAVTCSEDEGTTFHIQLPTK